MKTIERTASRRRASIANLTESADLQPLSPEELAFVSGGLVCTTQYKDGTNDEESQTCTTDIYFDNRC